MSGVLLCMCSLHSKMCQRSQVTVLGTSVVSASTVLGREPLWSLLPSFTRRTTNTCMAFAWVHCLMCSGMLSHHWIQRPRFKKIMQKKALLTPIVIQLRALVSVNAKWPTPVIFVSAAQVPFECRVNARDPRMFFNCLLPSECRHVIFLFSAFISFACTFNYYSWQAGPEALHVS